MDAMQSTAPATKVAPDVRFLTYEQAAEAWDKREPNQHLTIYLIDPIRLYASTSHSGEQTMKPVRSRILSAENPPIDPEAFIAFAYTDNEVMQCLDVQGDERRLNKRDCVGKALAFLDKEIAEPRAQAISEAVLTGEPVEYEYTHEWRDLTWKFRGVVRHFPQEGEVLVQLYDVQNWQAPWWKALEELSANAA